MAELNCPECDSELVGFSVVREEDGSITCLFCGALLEEATDG